MVDLPGKRALARRLSRVQGFESPRADREQYLTPPGITASIVHFADLRDDIRGRQVLDLGCGTGMLGIAATFREPAEVIGVDIDRGAILIALENSKRLEPLRPIHYLQADVTAFPLCGLSETTVLMNPPFGAQRRHADRPFLELASTVASISYSIHNAESRSFVSAFAEDNDGEVTDIVELSLDLPRQFAFHDEDTQTITAELYRIKWTG